MRLTDGISRRLVLGNKYATQLFDKLKLLEDVEEKLGIDLVTLFKVLKNGTYIYYKKGKKIERGVINHFLNVPNAWYITICGNDKFYSTRKYGKTWALTKEELL